MWNVQETHANGHERTENFTVLCASVSAIRSGKIVTLLSEDDKLLLAWKYFIFVSQGYKVPSFLTSKERSGLSTPGGGGWGYSQFSSYVGLGSTSTVHPKKYQEIQAPQKIFEILATPKNIPILYLDLKKRP